MPRYFFHLHNDVDAVDEEEVELPDLPAAQLVALHHARFSAGQAIKEPVASSSIIASKSQTVTEMSSTPCISETL